MNKPEPKLKCSIVKRINRLAQFGSQIFRAGLLAIVMCSGLTFAANYPERLSNRKDIQVAKSIVEDIDIWSLPIEDYPLLSKFTKLKKVRFTDLEGKGGTDAKLKALADLHFTNLTCIELLNCPMVTDEGIIALTKFRSLTQLALEGTSITDTGCEVIATRMHVVGTNSGVNVASCPKVTQRGLKALATSNLENLSFSTENLTESQVLDLIDSFNKIIWCEIVDSQRKLDAHTVRAKGAGRNIKIFVRPTGALQEMKTRRQKK